MIMQSKKVTKYDLVEAIYEDTNYEKKIIQDIVESFLEQVKESLVQSKTIELRGFGTFELRLRKGKAAARNPKTGEQVSVAPHYVAAFRSGRDLKNSLWAIPTPKN
ncbi:MAG: integration host factor subunit beta [Treponema sp.]|nr:integration host factor subunit beta [Treponema sp.]HBG36077.1 integration host factor subunit beta [Treponema sp.]